MWITSGMRGYYLPLSVQFFTLLVDLGAVPITFVFEMVDKALEADGRVPPAPYLVNHASPESPHLPTNAKIDGSRS